MLPRKRVREPMSNDYITIVYDFGPTKKSRTANLTEVDIANAARATATLVLSERPPVLWSANLGGRDVTAELAHVVRAVVGGNEVPEAQFFLEGLQP